MLKNLNLKSYLITSFLGVVVFSFLSIISNSVAAYGQQTLQKLSGGKLVYKNAETVKSQKDMSVLNDSDMDPNHSLFLGGLNNYLDQYGVKFSADWVTETAGVISGGKRRGADFTQQVALSLDVDWEKLAAIKGFSTHVLMIHRSGRNASADYVGDSQIQAQEVYGGGYSRLIRMYDLYGEQKLWNDRIDIKVGRMSVGDNFAHSSMACQFMLLTTCGHPRSTQSQQGFSDWPGAVWGGRILYNITPQSYVQVGAYQSTPWPQGGRTGWDWGTSQTTGAFVPIEFGYNPDIGKNHLIGHIHLGAGLDSSKFETWSAKVTGSGKTDYRSQFWLQADQMIYRNDPVEDHGLYVLVNWGHDATTTSSFKDFYNLGFLDRGFWKARPNDQFGVMLTYYTVPRGLSHAQQYQINNGLQYGSNGSFSLFNGAPGPQSNSTLVELNYGFAAYRGVMVMPIFEYFHNIAATQNVYKDAALLGLKTNVTF